MPCFELLDASGAIASSCEPSQGSLRRYLYDAFLAKWAVLIIAAASLGYPSKSSGASAVRDESGYSHLAAELGSAMPLGATVHVGMVEANADPNFPNTPGSKPDYLPNPANIDFVGKTFNQLSQPGDSSFHATIVGSVFYGASGGIAPGVKNVDMYFVDDWSNSQYLNYATAINPPLTQARVFNHSWVDQADAEYLSRVDYTVDRYDVLHVVGVNNANQGGPIAALASAYNTFGVGLSSGAHASGVVTAADPVGGLGIYDITDRQRPDVVVNQPFTSYAAPAVAGVAALLVETAHQRPELSQGFRELTGEIPYVIQNGETSEVLRSLLRVGANRDVWTDFRAPSQQSQNGLDRRYGAGQLNLYNSYHVLTAGEQASLESGGDAIDRAGFDYANGFGSEDSASYSFTTGRYNERLAASLSWNAKIETSSDLFWQNPQASAANFQLELYEVHGDERLPVAASLSPHDNSENILSQLLKPNTSYLLEVARDDTFGDWDYGLAWNRSAITPLGGDVDLDGKVDILDFAILRRNFSKRGPREAGDLDGDGLISLSDFAILRSTFGMVYQSTGEPTPPLLSETEIAQFNAGANHATAVPEPTTLCAAAAMAVLFAARARRNRH